MSSDYRRQPLFRDGEETPSTSSKATPVVVRQSSDAAASSSVVSSRLPPRRFSQRNSVASSAIIAPARQPGATERAVGRHGSVITASTPIDRATEAEENGEPMCVAFSAHSSTYRSGNTSRTQASHQLDTSRHAMPAAAITTSTTTTGATTSGPLQVQESLGEPEPSVSEGAGDWVDSLDEAAVVAAPEPLPPPPATHVSSRANTPATTPPVLYGTVEGRARRASSCSNPTDTAVSSQDLSPPPRPVVGGFAPPLSVSALTKDRAAERGGAGKKPSASGRSGASVASRATNNNARSHTPRSVTAHSHSSASQPFVLRTSSPQRASVVRHQSELLRMELDKPVHRVPPAEMGRLMALPRGNDSALPTGMTRLDLAQEEDVKELFRQQYLVDPLMRKRPGKRQFYVPPQADIFGMYGIRDLPLDEDEGEGHVVDDDSSRPRESRERGGDESTNESVAAVSSLASVSAKSGKSAKSGGVSRQSAARVSQEPHSVRTSEAPSVHASQVSSEQPSRHAPPQSQTAVVSSLSDSASQRASSVSEVVMSPPPQADSVPASQSPRAPSPRPTSRQELLERCAQRRQARQQLQQQQQQPVEPAATTRSSVAASRATASSVGAPQSTSRSVTGQPRRDAPASTSAQADSRAPSTRLGEAARDAASRSHQRTPASSLAVARAHDSDEAAGLVKDWPGRARTVSTEDGDGEASSSVSRPSRHRAQRQHQEQQLATRRSRADPGTLPPTPTRVIAVATAVVAEERNSPGEPQYTLTESSTLADSEDEAAQDPRRRPGTGRRGRPSIQPTAERVNLDLSWHPTEAAQVSHDIDTGTDYVPSVRQREAIQRQFAQQPDNVHQRDRPHSQRFTPEMALQNSHGDHDIFGVSARVGQLAMDAALRQYNEKRQQQQQITETCAQRERAIAAPHQRQQQQQQAPPQRPMSHHTDASVSCGSSQYVNRRDEPRPYPSRVAERAGFRPTDDARGSRRTHEVVESLDDGDDASSDRTAESEMYAFSDDVDDSRTGPSEELVVSSRASSPPHSCTPEPPAKEAPSHYLPYSAAPYAPVRRPSRSTRGNAKSALGGTSSIDGVSPIPCAATTPTTTQTMHVSSRGDETSFLVRQAPTDGDGAHVCHFCGHSVGGDAGRAEWLAMSEGEPSSRLPSAGATGSTVGRGRRTVSVPPRQSVEETGPATPFRPRDHDIFLRRPPTAADMPVPSGRRRSVSAGVGKSRRASQAYDSSQVLQAFRWK